MVPGLMADVPAAVTRRWADFRRRAGVKTAGRAHAAPHRAGGLARNCLRDWHEHDVGVVNVRALLVCATHQRHRRSLLRQAAELLPIHFARMATHHRLATDARRDCLRSCYFLCFCYRQYTGAWETRRPQLALALAR